MGTNVRDQTIDIAKGLAIIAIVLGHVLRGLGASGILDVTSAFFSQTDRFLYIGHLVVFAFLSGLFIRQGVERNGASVYLRPRLTLFLYLYLLWQIFQGSVKFATGALVNSPVRWSDIIRFWKPEGQLWFLPFLILATCITALTKPWSTPRRSIIALVLGSTISLITWGFDGGVVGTQGLALLLPFVAGSILGARRLLNFLHKGKTGFIAVILVVGLASLATILVTTGAFPPTINNNVRSVDNIGWGGLASTIALASVLCASLLMSQISLFRWLAFLGERSMEIFLAHIIAASGTRIALHIIGVDNLAVQIFLGTLAGIALPLLLWYVLRRVNFPWLFASPPILLGRRRLAIEGLQEQK